MATATKKKAKEDIEEKDDIDVLESVALSVTRKLTHPETGEEREFSQHELSFIPKTKFFRLTSRTLSIAATTEGQDGIALIESLFGGFENVDNDAMVMGILRLIELSPDFLEEAFIFALNVKPKDREWALAAFDSIDDDMGADIIEVFIAQNGPAIRDFLTKRLPKMGKRLSILISQDTEQE